jgi:16S rRNA (cytosine967-C5)-methyltransferase
MAAPLVKPGGQLVYVTCSILPEENDDQIAWFLGNHPAFSALPWPTAWGAAELGTPPQSAGQGSHGLLLTPARHGTDGFFISVVRRAP